MKRLIIDGRLGADSVIKKTKTGTPYLQFSLANNTYSKGENRTEWYDITSFDPHVINNMAENLKKGRMVFVIGTPNDEVNIDRNNKVWLNHYVTATTIDFVSTGRNQENTGVDNIPQMSTYSPAPEMPKPAEDDYAKPTLTENSTPTAGYDNLDDGDDDDLPF